MYEHLFLRCCMDLGIVVHGRPDIIVQTYQPPAHQIHAQVDRVPAIMRRASFSRLKAAPPCDGFQAHLEAANMVALQAAGVHHEHA